MNGIKESKEKIMIAIKSISFVAGWIITAYIGFWAMALYGVSIGIVAWRTYDHR